MAQVKASKPITAPSSSPDSDVEARIIGAVRDEIVSYGLRRASLVSIARRAGVSRATVYRRGGDMRQLLRDALNREYEQALERAADLPPQANAREDLIERGRVVLTRLVESPLLAAVLRHDPEVMLPYLVERYGRAQRTISVMLESALAAGVEDGSIPPLEVTAASHMLLAAATSLLVGRAAIAAHTEEGPVHREFEAMVRAYLTPAGARS